MCNVSKCPYGINRVKLTCFCSSASLQTNNSKFASEVTLNPQSLYHVTSRHENLRKGFVSPVFIGDGKPAVVGAIQSRIMS